MAVHQVTILDIAKELGISKSTVSRALANHPNVHPETRKRVLEVAKFHEYQPNMLAKSLLQQKTFNLGVVIPDIQKPFFASIVSGIQQVAFKSGYRIIITQSNESTEEEIANIKALMLSRVDGLLVCHTKETTQFEEIKRIYRKAPPIVEFARITPNSPLTTVVENDVGGAYTMVRHLLDGGAKRVGLLSGPKELLVSRLREKGYKTALKMAGIALNKKWIVHTKFLKEDIAMAFAQWSSLSHFPDAVFAMYDAGAVGLIRYLKQKGITVPNDVQIAGFGDDPVAELITPSLTTYAQNPFKIGQVTCEQMLNILNGNTDIKNLIVPGKLVKRQSTMKG